MASDPSRNQKSHMRSFPNSEAARAVIKAAFATGRKRLWATVGTWNAPSFRVLEKNAFHTHHSDCDERGEFAWMVGSAANCWVATAPIADSAARFAYL